MSKRFSLLLFFISDCPGLPSAHRDPHSTSGFTFHSDDETIFADITLARSICSGDEGDFPGGRLPVVDTFEKMNAILDYIAGVTEAGIKQF